MFAKEKGDIAGIYHEGRTILKTILSDSVLGNLADPF